MAFTVPVEATVALPDPVRVPATQSSVPVMFTLPSPAMVPLDIVLLPERVRIFVDATVMDAPLMLTPPANVALLNPYAPPLNRTSPPLVPVKVPLTLVELPPLRLTSPARTLNAPAAP